MTSYPARYRDLPGVLEGTALEPWAGVLSRQAEQTLKEVAHGDLPRWYGVLDQLPKANPDNHLDRAMPILGQPVANTEALKEQLMSFHPWRKGPLQLGGVPIDTEWRSDRKWDRLAGHLQLEGETILDVGCGNGYFGWRMLGQGAHCVVGIDPTLVFVMQWLAQAHFAPGSANFVLPLRDTDLPADLSGFDRVFSMGVLYHRRQPQQHLQQLAGWLRPGGQLVLETLVLDEPGEACLVPQGRYARMRNVWYVPSIATLAEAVVAAGFSNVRVVDVSPTTAEEQRSTPWMRFESLQQCLDNDNPERTVEGHPAPVRAALLADRS